MRVLLVSHVAPPHIGGVESVVWMEAQAFRDAGHEVVWVTSDGTGDGTPPEEGERLRIVRVKALHLLERWFGVAYPFFAPTLPFRLWREVARADLVHVHGLVFPGSPIAALFGRLRKKRVLCTDHGGLLQYRSRLATLALRALMETMGRVTARCAHKLIALNHDVEALLTRLSGRRDKVQFLPNPVDVAMFQPPTPEQRRAAREALGWDGRPRVLCVSRLLPHKGIDVLLGARHASFEVVFCGPGDDAMRAHIRDSGAECLAPRPHEEVRQLYHAADAFALPSYNEGFPVAIQEALACGLPVLTSDIPSYAPYAGTPGLHLCEPTSEQVQRHLLDLLARPTAAAARANEGCARTRWLDELMTEGAA
jgi:D-inositol-3-phosphate glycosyltransferase